MRGAERAKAAQAARRPCRRRHANGFSLMETLIALAIVAGLSSLALLSFGGSRDTLALRAEATRVAGAFEQARTLALETARRVDVAFDARSRRLTTTAEGEQQPSAALALAYADPAAHPPPISFYSDGGSSGGSVLLRAAAQAYRVDVAWPTGRVSARRV
jgi:general secretion pathway protein H